MSTALRILALPILWEGMVAPVLAEGELAPSPLQVLQSIERVGEYERLGPPAEYVPDNLWEYINGGAALFVSYDFVTMATATYVPEDEARTATVDVYLVPDGLRAFGLYSRERGPRSQHIGIGASGLIDGPAGRFYEAEYYVKVKIMPPPESVRDDVEALMRAVDERLPGGSDPPAVLGAFPLEGQVPDTLSYIGTDLLGHAFLRNGFLVDYDLGAEDPARVFLFVADGADEAASALAQLRAFFDKRGADVAGLDGVGDAAFTGTEPYYGPSIAFCEGHVVAGAVRIPDAESALGVLREIVDNIKGLQ